MILECACVFLKSLEMAVCLGFPILNVTGTTVVVRVLSNGVSQ